MESLKALEVFRNDVLKKEYEEFINEILPKVLNCNYYNISYCNFHSRFVAFCKKCCSERCNNCRVFNLQMDMLMQAADVVGKNYIFNFVLDFLNISSESLRHFYNIESSSNNEKRQFLISWKMHEEHGRKNYTSNISSAINKYQYQMKKRKRIVYIKK